MNRAEPAIESLVQAGRFSGQNSKAISFRDYVLAKAGRTAEAQEVLKTLQTAARDRYVPPYAMALVHAGLGQRDAVFERLERVLGAGRSPHIPRVGRLRRNLSP